MNDGEPIDMQTPQEDPLELSIDEDSSEVVIRPRSIIDQTIDTANNQDKVVWGNYAVQVTLDTREEIQRAEQLGFKHAGSNLMIMKRSLKGGSIIRTDEQVQEAINFIKSGNQESQK